MFLGSYSPVCDLTSAYFSSTSPTGSLLFLKQNKVTSTLGLALAVLCQNPLPPDSLWPTSHHSDLNLNATFLERPSLTTQSKEAPYHYFNFITVFITTFSYLFFSCLSSATKM